MAEWDVVSSVPVAAPQQADPWAVKVEAKVDPAAAGHFDKTIEGLKKVGGEAGAIADFFLSVPAFMIGAGAQLTGTVRAMSEGSREPFAQGRAVSAAVNEQLGSPVRKVLDLFRSGEAYEQSHTTKGLEKLMSLIDEAGVWAEKASGGAIARDAVPMLLETIMAGAPGLGAKAKPFAPKHVTEALRAHTEKMRAAGEAELAEQRRLQLTPQEEIARQPIQQEINSLLGIRTPQEQAQITKSRRKDINNIGRERELSEAEQTQLDLAESRGVRQYGDIGESAHYAEERTPSQPATVGQAQVLDILQKPGVERTAEDLATLRSARGEGQAGYEGNYRDGGTFSVEYASEPRADGSFALSRTLKDSDGTRIEHLSDDGTWARGKPARATVQGVRQLAGPESFRSPDEALASAKEDAGSMGAKPRAGRQSGNATPEVMALLSAAGIGTLVGAPLDDNHLRGAILGGATGLAAVLPFIGRGASVPSFRRQAGAVKAPGGMWHPEAVERLAEPLASKLRPESTPYDLSVAEMRRGEGSQEAYYDKAMAAVRWSDKAIKNYLNKYAGTERDPLKDVEILLGPGVTRWEAITDAVIKSNRAKDLLKPLPEGVKAPPEETVYHLGSEIRSGGAQAALTSYLSHVGDYLRQNVDPAKLQQYDLVRAVKETAENDKRVAKEMEKAAAESSKDLPVYKEYPDGMKWVELKEPKELTPEQAKGVRKLTKEEAKQYSRESEMQGGDEWGEGARPYVALDSKGKPIQNTYTGEPAIGKNPTRAHLAGQLAQEGNQMGHCVGGYCEGVASGESKIFSLRDKKGLSHVTVEVGASGNFSLTNGLTQVFGDVTKAEAALKQIHNLERSTNNPTFDAAFKELYPAEFAAFVELRGNNISQIKGKQNRAPNAEYLPYVQDFVKGGKWGEVEDLGNTGLADIQASKLNSGPYRKLAEELFPGQRFLNEADARKLQDEGVARTLAEQDARDKQLGLEGGRPIRGRLGEGERGSIDQQLLMGLGAVGLGGLIGSQLFDEPGTGALIGALTGGVLRLPGTKTRFDAIVKAADYGIGNISTRIGNISEPLKLRARQFEMRNLSEARARLDKVVPWMQEMAKLPEGQLKSALERVILTNDRAGIATLMKGNRPLVDGWRQVRNVLDELGTKLQGHGRFKEMKGEYFPRLVADVVGLKEALDIPVRTKLEAALKKAEDAAMKQRGTPLTNIEQSAIINRELQAVRRPISNQPGYTKPRGVDEITEALRPFYHSPAESLYAYIRGATTDLEMARFFGKDLAQKSGTGGAQYIDVGVSIGNVVGRELREKKITPKQADELIDMLKSRFGQGERSPAGLVQELRNLGNIGLLGNIVSAATQGADALMAVYAQGFRASLAALANKLSGKEHISTHDFGLAEHVAEEFTSPSRTANWLNKMFKYSGFSGIDQFGKNMQLESALNRYTRLAQSPDGITKIKQKYGEAYGDEFPKLVKDLKDGNITERVRLLAFSELSDMQPISKLELPQHYLDNPNGRIVHMLKTFMEKQMDVVRRDVYNEFKRGNIAVGLKNATSYAAVLGIAGATTDMIKNWLMGRPMSFEGTDVAENILKTFGMGAYVRDKIKQGHPIEALMGAVVPPYKMLDDIIRRDPKAVQYVPIIGKLYYNWELGGREAAEIRNARKAKQQGQDVDLSERAIEYRTQKREAAREKRERAQQ